MSTIAFFATAAKGTEPVLRDELRALRLPEVRCDRGGVHFAGAWEDGWRACLHSRLAMRIFAKVAEYPAGSPQALYDGARAVSWDLALTPRQTLAVSAYCRSSAMTNPNFISVKLKDAVVDQIRDKLGNRPDVARQDPDVRIFVHLVKDQATLYLDLAGESLHRRGYRRETREAPIKETLAAALIAFAGFDGEVPFLDPMCGSGTIAIEAALMACRIAPGLFRDRFGFERWASFDLGCKTRMKALREEARALKRKAPAALLASDIDPKAIEVARQNARGAGVEIRFGQRSVQDCKPLVPPGVVVSNPPYGQRLAAEDTFLQELGKKFQTFGGHTICLLTGEKQAQHQIGLKVDRFQILYNGDIECWMFIYRP